MSIGRTARASETRAPVWARMWANVWSAGRGAKRAASRKRWRSSAVRYFRPRASTSWRSRIRRDISLNVVSTVAVPQGPAWASWSSVKAATAVCRGSAADRK